MNIWASLIIITSCKYYHISDLDPKVIINGTAQPDGMNLHNLHQYTMFCRKNSWIDRFSLRKFLRKLKLTVKCISDQNTTDTMIHLKFF